MPKNQFDRYAISYSQNKQLQRDIADKLTKMTNGRFNKILDVGCGDGAVYDAFEFDGSLFVGVDASEKMCALHRTHEKAVTLQKNFDDSDFASEITRKFGKFDLVISSSALQWSDNLNKLVENLSSLGDNFAFAVFTRGTFASVREFLGVDSFLPTIDELKEALGKYDVDILAVEQSKKKFDSPKDAMRFMKTTGVSGGGNKVSYKDAKRLYESGPSALEFEVVYAVGSFAKSDFSAS